MAFVTTRRVRLFLKSQSLGLVLGEAAVWQTCWISALLLTDSEVQSHLYLQRFSGDQCGLGLQVGALSRAPWRFTGVERIKNHEKARFSDETGLSKVVTPEEKHNVLV